MMSYKCLFVCCRVDQCRSLTICAVLRTQDFCLLFGSCQLDLLWRSRCGLKLEKSIPSLHVSNITSFSTSRLFCVEAKRTCPFFSSKNATASIQPKGWRSIFVWWISTSKPTIHVAKSWSACHVKPLVGDWHFPFFLGCFGLFCDIWVISPIWLDVNCQEVLEVSPKFPTTFVQALISRRPKCGVLWKRRPSGSRRPQGVFQVYSSALKDFTDFWRFILYSLHYIWYVCIDIYIYMCILIIYEYYFSYFHIFWLPQFIRSFLWIYFLLDEYPDFLKPR